jgi:hypothetical protein
MRAFGQGHVSARCDTKVRVFRCRGGFSRTGDLVYPDDSADAGTQLVNAVTLSVGLGVKSSQ